MSSQYTRVTSAKSQGTCLHFKLAPVINDKKHPKPLVVTGALHGNQWIWGPPSFPPKSSFWIRQSKKGAWIGLPVRPSARKNFLSSFFSFSPSQILFRNPECVYARIPWVFSKQNSVDNFRVQSISTISNSAAESGMNNMNKDQKTHSENWTSKLNQLGPMPPYGRRT